MKNITMLIALGCFSALSANPYYSSSCPSCNQGGGYYQGQGGGYYQGQGGGYYQDQGQNYYRQDSNQYPQSGYSNNQGYSGSYQYESQQSRGSQNPYGQNSSYNQGQQRSYDQPRNYDNNSSYSQGNNSNQQGYNNNYNSSNAQGNNGSDQDVNKEVRDTLGSGWFSRGFQNVSFDVNNGYVTLRGTVDTLEDKNKVEEKVRHINGVKQVNNQITVSQNKNQPRDYSESDLQKSEAKFPNDSAGSLQDRNINAKIREKLSNNWFSRSYDALVIRTANGVVVIAGTVDNNDDVQKINDQVKGIDGVQSVNNQVTVKNK